MDRAAPASDNSVPQPHWQRGDRFTYRRGGKLRMELLVADKQADGYVLQEVGSGMRFGMGLDLSRRSETVPGSASQDRQFAPSDQVLTWPLWVGKQWSCEYLLKTLAGDAIPILANYECDARETITVPAGSFDSYRIVRNSRPVSAGNYLDKTAVLWYSAEVGYFVRRIEDGVITELESFQRQ